MIWRDHVFNFGPKSALRVTKAPCQFFSRNLWMIQTSPQKYTCFIIFFPFFPNHDLDRKRSCSPVWFCTPLSRSRPRIYNFTDICIFCIVARVRQSWSPKAGIVWGPIMPFGHLQRRNDYDHHYWCAFIHFAVLFETNPYNSTLILFPKHISSIWLYFMIVYVLSWACLFTHIVLWIHYLLPVIVILCGAW